MFRSHNEILIRRSWYSVLPSLELRRGQLSVESTTAFLMRQLIVESRLGRTEYAANFLYIRKTVSEKKCFTVVKIMKCLVRELVQFCSDRQCPLTIRSLTYDIHQIAISSFVTKINDY